MLTAWKQKWAFTLNQLIVTCKDGQEGFHDAGERVQDTELKQVFLTFEQQRKQLLAELKPEVFDLTGEPDAGGLVAVDLQRGWLKLRPLLSDSDDAAVIDEAERSEDIAERSYRAALNEDLPLDLRTLVLRQYYEIMQAHARISAIKRAQLRSV